MSDVSYRQWLAAGGLYAQPSPEHRLRDDMNFSDDFSTCTLLGSTNPTSVASEIASHSQRFATRNDASSSSRRRDMRSIDAVLQSDTPPKSTAATLPTEIIHMVYANMGPTGFNAARHSCHNWMVASLDFELLIEQLKRGGWWTTATSNPTLFQEWRHQWPMSCFLSRECALAEDFTRNGVKAAFPVSISGPLDLNDRQPVVVTSLCGEYCAIAQGTQIDIYRLEDAMDHVASIDCEKAVVAMSIHAEPVFLGALLEDRIGIMVDLSGSRSAATLDLRATGGLDGDDVQPDGPSLHESVGSLDELSLNAGSVGSRDLLHQSVDVGTSRSWSEHLRDRQSWIRGMRVMRKSESGLWPAELDISQRSKRKATIPTVRPQRVYRHVCWENDAPLSVAVSPNGHCLAFGSVTGVELYWMDASTGRGMNRYFTLSRPSEVLHFLPPRQYIDSLHKLRLISSPASAPAVASPTSSASGTWITMAGRWRSAFSSSSKGIEGHCRAVPLSDGHHILFIDQNTGLVCLGADQPVGSAEKLSRKFVFKPPKHLWDCIDQFPRAAVYAAASNLDDGVRIAAAYGDEIVLYSVPVDALRYSTAQQEETLQALDEPFESLQTADILPHPISNSAAVLETTPKAEGVVHFDKLNMIWAHWLPATRGQMPKSAEEIWPVQVTGAHIGSVESPVALAVQAGSAVAVWAFGKDGQTEVWCG